MATTVLEKIKANIASDEKMGRHVRPVRNIVVGCRSDRELVARMRAFGKDFKERTGDAHLIPADDDERKYLETVTLPFYDANEGKYYTPTLAIPCGLRSSVETEADAEQTTNELFNPPKPNAEQHDPAVDWLFNRKRT